MIRNPGCYQTSVVADKATETHIRVLSWLLNGQGKKGEVPKKGKKLASSNVQSWSFCRNYNITYLNSNKSTNQMQQFLNFIILTFIYSSTCFGRPHAHHQELNNCSSSLWFYLHIVVIALLLFVVRPVKAQYVSDVLTPIIKSSTTAVAASGFTHVSWW